MNIYTVTRYARYCLFSRHKRGHGLHSPFLYNLVSITFRNKINPGVVLMIEELRRKYCSDKRIISVTDMGAGSARMKGNNRRVSEIAKYSALPEKYGILLARLASEFGKGSIIEFGTSLGFSTMYMAAVKPAVTVYTMEGCPSVASLAAENFRNAGLSNIRLLTGSFDDLLPELTEANVTPGFVFIDGNHRKEAVCRYFNWVAEISAPDTVIAIDDIHSSKEMGQAWEEIKYHEQVSSTVDIFRMGIVFFRKNISKGNYVIRY
jgi:predicted O-methyltransferase YrrM